jgi:hypothetical protein
MIYPLLFARTLAPRGRVHMCSTSGALRRLNLDEASPHDWSLVVEA